MAYCKIKKDGTPAKRPGRKPGPPKPKSTFNPHAPRPHRWVSGTDEELHLMYMPFLKSKAQANFRGEPWTLDFNSFANLWRGKWDQRGRKGHNLCMTRISESKPWANDNIELVTRREHMVRQGLIRVAKRPVDWPEGMSYYNYKKMKRNLGL